MSAASPMIENAAESKIGPSEVTPDTTPAQ